jgi:hypothetical protein
MKFENALDVVLAEAEAELLAATIELSSAGPVSYDLPAEERARLRAEAWASLDDDTAGSIVGPAAW